MHHMLAFYSGGTIAASTVDKLLSAVQDGAFTISNSRFLLPQALRVQRSYLWGANVIEGKITVPSLRMLAEPRLYPVDKNAAPANDSFIEIYDNNGPRILASEEMGVKCTVDAGTAAAGHAFIWMASQFTPAPQQDIFKLKFTSAAVAAVGQWAGGTMTLESALPAGRYALVGADAYGTNLAGMRFRFQNQIMMPGIVCQQAAGEFFQGHQRNGKAGLFGTFDNINLPTIEVYGNGTTDTQIGYLDLQKIG